jgi:hypothetical protein
MPTSVAARWKLCSSRAAASLSRCRAREQRIADCSSILLTRTAFLFHCTTCKDRTGWAAAALLSLLGVPENVVYDDFLRSNDYILPAYQQTIDAFTRAGGDPAIYAGHPWCEVGISEGIFRRDADQIRHDLKGFGNRRDGTKGPSRTLPRQPQAPDPTGLRGSQMIAVDTLVHNFLHRTGIFETA